MEKKSGVATSAAIEGISVALRRQVPIRFDEDANSWIGGLPKMPVEVEWPHAKPKKPLHFMAQIKCADLPHELWGGLGPRTGWLLLFADMEALTDQIKRPFARVLHIAELGPEAAPPPGLYFARSNVGDVSKLKGTLPGVQRRHFRKWPIDLVPVAADTSKLTGSELYDAPENDLSLSASGSIGIDRPMTWRGAYIMLAGLVFGHSTTGSATDLARKFGCLLDYPEPDAKDFNEEWGKRRTRIAEQLPKGYHCPEFVEADDRLIAFMFEERRAGWTQRAFKVLEEETAKSVGLLSDYRAKLAAAMASGDDNEISSVQQSIEYFEKQVSDRRGHRTYLENLFAQYPSEDALVEEIKRTGHAHLEWVQRTQDRLRVLLEHAGRMDLDAPIAPGDWDDIASQISGMRSVYWTQSSDTDVLRKVERGIQYTISNVVREEALDRYVSPPASSDGLDPAIVAELEPKLRHLETGRPHKLGGMIDSVYDGPIKKDHILLFQLASDAATGWIMGDLGLLYVSILRSDLEACAFDHVKSWLEA